MSKRLVAIGAAVALAAFAAIATAAPLQSGAFRITFFAQLKPYKLPRDRPAPIAVFIAGHLASTTGGVPPQLRELRIEVNRHGLLQSQGLAVCRVPEVQPASTQRALENCRGALIGSGRFWAN